MTQITPTTVTLLILCLALVVSNLLWIYGMCLKNDCKDLGKRKEALVGQCKFLREQRNKLFTEKVSNDGPKVLAEDPTPHKALQARIEKSPDSARNLASVVPEKTADEHSFGGKTAESKWPAQDRYRLKKAREGFVRAYNDDGRSPYTPVENTAWIKGEREWIRVKRDSKRFKKASFFFPGDYDKPTKTNYWQLLNRVHQDIEKADGREV